MDDSDVSCIEFLDLSDIEENQKLWIKKFLTSQNSQVVGPWNKTWKAQSSSLKPPSGAATKETPLSVQTPVYQVPYTQVQPFSYNNVHNNQFYAIQPQYNHPVVFTQTNYQTPVQTYQPQQQMNITSPASLASCNVSNKSSHVPTSQENWQQQTQNMPLMSVNGKISNDNINLHVNGSMNEPQWIPQDNTANVKNDIMTESQTTQEIDKQNDNDDGKSQTENTSSRSAGKSWASLFNKNKTNSNDSTPTHNQVATEVPTNYADVDNNNEEYCESSPLNEPTYHRMGEFLIGHKVDNRVTSLQPRGLINRSNYCYINSILQALLACPPFYNLLVGLNESIKTSEKCKLTPFIDNMLQFIKEFHHQPAIQRVGRRSDKNQRKEQISVTCDPPFEPNWIYKMLRGKRTDSFVVEGRQEDAEEFFGCLLNGLNDEMEELLKLVSKKVVTKVPVEEIIESSEDKEWQVMGPKNKSCVTRRAEIGKTPINDIFGGQLKSRIDRTGDHFTDNIQPFFTLQLNIETVSSVKEALEALVSKNRLEGVTSSKTNQEVEAWQQVTIEDLPVILVLHLKCFNFKPGGCTKIMKSIEFPVDLKIDSKLLSSKTNYTPKDKQYKLFAVVYHDGKEATKGHYLTDSYHVGYGSWLRYDDASVKPVQEEQVLKPHGSRVPYLLFYRRTEAVKTK